MEIKGYIILITLLISLIAIFFFQIWDGLNHLIDFHDDIDKTTMQLLESRGFKGEDHYVVTEDGYILLLTRIINPFVDDRNKLKPIVLNHGWMCNANIWLINSMARLDEDSQYTEDNNSGPVGNNLALVLAINGFDVWLPNKRGTEYSTNHTKLNVQDAEYWRFTVDQMVDYDLPAVISYIQMKTGKDQLSYIGHSQGNFEMLGLLSAQPQYSAIVKPFIAISPVFHQEHSGNVMPLMKYSYYHYNYYRSWEGPFLTPHLAHLAKRIAKTCDLNRYTRLICYKAYFYSIFGFEENQMNMTRSAIYFANLFVGSSHWQLAHFLQGPRLGEVKKFDFGDKEKNMVQYGSSEPPNYDMSAINSTHIALIYAANDWCNHLQDVQRLKDELKVPLLDDYLVPDPTWNHMELLMGIDVGKLVNTRIMNILSKSIG